MERRGDPAIKTKKLFEKNIFYVTFRTARAYIGQEGKRLQPNTRFKPDIDAAYRQHSDMLYRVALAQLGNDSDAQDAVQDVFIRYISHAPVFDSPDHEKAWLVTVTANRCRDLLRKRRRRGETSLESVVEIAEIALETAEVY